MNNNWKEIWNEKKSDISLEKLAEYDLFCELKRLDGFDVNVCDQTKYYTYFYHKCKNMMKEIESILKEAPKSVFEVGCGSGVNLKMFQNKYDNIKIGGIDYSEGLISIASNMLQVNTISCDTADNLDVTEKYDVVLSDSVFQYFSDEEYAENVLIRMLEKSNKIVFLGEIHDLEMKEECINYRRSQVKDYDIKYKGLDKLFLSREWFIKIANRCNRKVIFVKPEISEEYLNSKFIYDCYIF